MKPLHVLLRSPKLIGFWAGAGVILAAGNFTHGRWGWGLLNLIPITIAVLVDEKGGAK